MEQEIYIIDEHNTEHRVRYIDKEKVSVQQVTRYLSDSEATGLGMPAKVKLDDIDSWPFTKGLQDKILSWHAEFPDAE